MAILALEVPENSAAALQVIDALRALGATIVHQDGVIRTETPTGVCVVCGEAFALSALEDRAALGGPACKVCRQVAARIYDEFQMAVRRHWAELRGQLPQAVRDIRGGAPAPVFYQGFD